MKNNCYWVGTGKYQTYYNKMAQAQFTYTKKDRDIARAYYRYYNDGDIPRFKGIKTTSSSQDIRRILEQKVDEMLVREYNRYIKKKEEE